MKSLRGSFDGVPRARKIIVGLIGATIVLFGIDLIVLPGPGVLVIAIGLAVLASEFMWARRLLRRARQLAGKARRGVETARSIEAEKIS